MLVFSFLGSAYAANVKEIMDEHAFLLRDGESRRMSFIIRGKGFLVLWVQAGIHDASRESTGGYALRLSLGGKPLAPPNRGRAQPEKRRGTYPAHTAKAGSALKTFPAFADAPGAWFLRAGNDLTARNWFDKETSAKRGQEPYFVGRMESAVW